ncbi:MAG: glycerol-3-phosphate 1-O-acyltransferase PlsY [Thiofilum sp.]|uniref:glycerol-3-phosphate 1-O-acyltransferase PlsY n=1 Tax=Thiofilum sp. TaxID=2212733 RepID=UPI0025EBD6D1|nr:glycerol-3-phosphate 1-O-acyltransferase PlsY [Thiofilum sp.]MBK8453886.1 glycerol-3-phosphate 1-O-acyltransferase PlsY [Thiofilum sp.]
MYPELSSLMPWLIVIAGYLLGSISAAIITAKAMNLPDPRSTGSKNPGATNMLRIGGKKAAIITLLGDGLKGFIPVFVAHYVLGYSYEWQVLIGLAAFLGHLYPVFYGFEGGKGVATAIGVYLALNFPAAMITIATWLIMARVFKYSSLAALTATLLAPLYFYLMTQNGGVFIGLLVMTAFIYYRHKSNIQNLLNGTEKKLGSR